MEETSAPEAEVHLLAIRRALANGNAAVMVGAGFSRNAEGGESLATWSQLSEALARELQPNSPLEAFAPSAVAQLAEQYARVYSPTHLEQFIKKHVPDDQVSPGILHTKLLELPWSEVFTTNYDTLLERAAERMFETSYFTVFSREDIPQSKILGRRRIVKLHGSFPSHRPFILTEEEYRTYPQRFAPFVNLVRQSLLENVLCLIGFSGDDPNFLRWLGWVRDMLDKHALPVYLFLAKEPTLGERKLYEARGVVPVILPNAGGNSDYRTRYGDLFAQLLKPLVDSPMDWGDAATDLNEAVAGDRVGEFLGRLRNVNSQRKSYPGWIVAPAEVRARFRRTQQWLQSSLHEAEVIGALQSRSADLVLTVFDLYCWAQSVMLDPLDDSIAAVGLKALFEPKSSKDFGTEEPSDLQELFEGEKLPVEQICVQAALALLTWARQSHRDVSYEKIKALLTSAAADVTVKDRIVHEDALRFLQRANRTAARSLVHEWQPQSSNAYAHVLRAALLAELGDSSLALPVLEHAIATLRRQQRSRPKDPALVSQEAWACLVARDLQFATEFSIRFRPRTFAAPSVASSSISVERENFELRLSTLVARGYSARDELRKFMADLDAEAEPPGREFEMIPGFDLGTSQRHRLYGGVPLRTQQKIGSALSWLELSERVGLPPHTDGANFYANQMLQASWWARFADTPERAIGLLLRANQTKSLNSTSASGEPHASGWLRRYDVAKLEKGMATGLARDLLEQLWSECDGPSMPDIQERRFNFLMEVFGRLAIREDDDQVLIGWGMKLLALHRLFSFQLNSRLWSRTTDALARVFESIRPSSRPELFLETLRLPWSPSATGARPLREMDHREWASLDKLAKSIKFDLGPKRGPEWIEVVDSAIHQLQSPNQKSPPFQLWRRLELMKHAGLLTSGQIVEVGKTLWRGVPSKGLPKIPWHSSVAVSFWPSPRGDSASLWLDSTLTHKFQPFQGGHMDTTLRSGRSYSIGGDYVDQILSNIKHRMPSVAQCSKLLRGIDRWIGEQGDALRQDMSDVDVSRSLQIVVRQLDEILSVCVRAASSGRSSTKSASVIDLVVRVDAKLSELPFLTIQAKMALVSAAKIPSTSLSEPISRLFEAIALENSPEADAPFSVAYMVLEIADSTSIRKARPVFDALVTVILSQRASTLPLAMQVLASLSRDGWSKHLSRQSAQLLDKGLMNLRAPLSYEVPVHASAFASEDVPLIRYRAASLAHALIEIAQVDSPAARAWIDDAKTDPLPEMRLGRYARAS
ncbi:SIR2 family NAD-dependent protein deacylase [Stenotrophomonas rhizophila]